MSPLTEPTKLTLAKGQPVPNDPYLYTNTVLLLHGDGANGSTNIVDSSRVAGSPKVVTPVGNAQISTAVADPFGNTTRGVIAFDKVVDRLTLAASPDLAFGTGDFTVEFWMYSRDVSSATQRGMLQTSDTSGGLKTTYTSGIVLHQGAGLAGGSNLNGGLVALIVGSRLGSNTPVLSLNTWHHIALSRSSGLTRLFCDGILHSSATISGSIDGQNLVVGGYYDPGSLFDGYIDDLRITKGVARYVEGTGANAGKMVFAGTNTPALPTAPFPDF